MTDDFQHVFSGQMVLTVLTDAYTKTNGDSDTHTQYDEM